MSSSPEMSVLNLRIHKGLLDCNYCRQPLLPDKWWRITYMCAGGHIFCRECTSQHKKACISCCHLLDGIMAQMKFKCNFCDSGNISYFRFLGHVCDHPLPREVVGRQIESVFALGECTLAADLLACSECNLPLRPPIFRHLSRNSPVCSACYCGDIDNYLHYRELDYLVQGITVKCVACEEYLPFSTLASHQLGDCPFKHKLQKIAPGSSAQKNLCDEEETEMGSNSIHDEDETERPTARNSSIHGKNKQKACYEVGKMGKHIVHGDAVGNDDDSSDDNHPESGMRVAENVFKTLACNKKVKTSTPYGQKTGAPTAAQIGASSSRHLPITAPSKPPRRPGTRLFQAAYNRPGSRHLPITAPLKPPRRPGTRLFQATYNRPGASDPDQM